jgi:hypothetical protein
MIGLGGPSFDEDDVIANNDDEDLRKDPVSHIDLRVSTSRGSVGPSPLADRTVLVFLAGACYLIYSRERSA